MRTEPELRHLRVFVTVVETGTHTRAARALGLSQSTVSETLAALERALGTTLLRKAQKGVALTPSGEALLPYARRILQLTRDAVGALAEVSNEVKGSLVVATVESVSAYVLPARLAALRARWPKAQLEVVTGTCAQIRESVAAGKSDLGLVLEADGGRAEAGVLAKGRLLVCAAPDHPLTRGRPSLERLRRCEFYMCDAGGNYHQVLKRYFEAAELPVPATQALGTVEGVKRGLRGTHAVALLPSHAVQAELEGGALAEVKVSPPMPGLVLRAVAARKATRSPLVADLLDGLRGTALA